MYFRLQQVVQTKNKIGDRGLSRGDAASEQLRRVRGDPLEAPAKATGTARCDAGGGAGGNAATIHGGGTITLSAPRGNAVLIK